ncbi:hypothetical protein BegalDRAFT_2813 [Beggiatoa alba B18LD]|uniref:DUF72 domain-containing protein n=1 Tax=Beggiatoa alba B18LD TaxID=395493 RepID=I3CJ55_9GAMM|nr:DUF72 domain-containing protein [Beggiatoa alba]EIJ43648.1 hypothetical protein BegalDRAFT_2813 [Beggiatoa alba B18LD]
MDFGKVKNLHNIQFKLPPTPLFTQTQLQQAQVTNTTIYVGCPVWAHKAWVGTLYPAYAKEKDFLSYYAQQFNTIELNSTHYHIPDSATTQRWKQSVPTHFRFCPKLPQEISHRQLLTGETQALTQTFCQAMLELKPVLGMCFLQLPPTFSPTQFPLLLNFLDTFPADIPLAVEFRHPAWFKAGYFATIAQVLAEKQIATVITDVAGRRDVLHQYLSTSTAFIRFVGNALDPTDYQRIDEWVTCLSTWIHHGLENLYFFAHEPDNTLSPQLAHYFITQLNQRCGLQIPLPHLQAVNTQGNLF